MGHSVRTVIDEYLTEVVEPARSTFGAVRAVIHEFVPEVEECMSYGIPAFRAPNGIVAGIAVNKKFCSYYPFSGSVLDKLAAEVAQYSRTKSALHFAFDSPLSPDLLKLLIETRVSELSSR